jgi:hypothetical protein
MSDVTICFNALKKMQQEFETRTGSSAQLQMVQPNARYVDLSSPVHSDTELGRPSALTLVADPRTAFAMEFDNMIAVSFIP